MTRVILKPRKALPFIYRHPWVFSGAIARIEGTCESGDVVDVLGGQGDFIGRGLYSAQSQITVRLLSWQPDEPIDDAFFRRRIADAIALRDRIIPVCERQTARRLVFSESDGLPGLIADQYADRLVVQFLSFGLDRRRDILLDALESLVHPAGIFERSDADVREKEGLHRRIGTLRGSDPPPRILIRDGGLAFEVDVRSGQKTGHYLDQRDNRAVVAHLAPGRRTLDAYCYSGGFGIAASLAGAASTLFIDSSEPALALARRNAELNRCTNTEFVRADALTLLRQQPERSAGLVILDPPALARSSYNIESALKAYAALYTAALRTLEPAGILAASCCSQHISAAEIVRTINTAAVSANRTVRILESRGQPADHPVAANCPETAYLKCLICSVA